MNCFLLHRHRQSALDFRYTATSNKFVFLCWYDGATLAFQGVVRCHVSRVVGLALASRQSSSFVDAPNELRPHAAAHEFTSHVVELTPWQSSSFADAAEINELLSAALSPPISSRFSLYHHQ